ncbi:unnamed protein product [Oikopleura dioica]|uniref:FERM domain-containing protein n=1 Tax=Oikopleura dioica TaxID=34765 RepID=E4XXI9_OIKDI|nr:unnamed protein product [Oikopleura dioica]
MKKEIQVEVFGAESKILEVEKKAKGHTLFDLMCDSLDIREKEYFGLYVSLKNDQRKWIRLDKEIKRQLKEPWLVKFCVKLYPPDPAYLVEEITRLYMYRQLRDDIAKGRLLASFVTHALLGSLAAQAELGDAPVQYTQKDHNALVSLKLAPNVSENLMQRISDLHVAHNGLKTSKAELKYLETASKLPLYGLHQFHVRDAENTDLVLACHFGGIYIMQNTILLNRFAWPTIIELSYKRDIFYVKVRAGIVNNLETKIGFICPSTGVAKRIWLIGIDHHHFFRVETTRNSDKGRKFQRTQAELIDQVGKLKRSNTHSLDRARSLRASRLFVSSDNLTNGISPKKSPLKSINSNATNTLSSGKIAHGNLTHATSEKSIGENSAIFYGRDKIGRTDESALDCTVMTELPSTETESESLLPKRAISYYEESSNEESSLDNDARKLSVQQRSRSLMQLRRNFMDKAL